MFAAVQAALIRNTVLPSQAGKWALDPCAPRMPLASLCGRQAWLLAEYSLGSQVPRGEAAGPEEQVPPARFMGTACHQAELGRAAREHLLLGQLLLCFRAGRVAVRCLAGSLHSRRPSGPRWLSRGLWPWVLDVVSGEG